MTNIVKITISGTLWKERVVVALQEAGAKILERRWGEQVIIAEYDGDIGKLMLIREISRINFCVPDRPERPREAFDD